jgi:hypothetical protein
MQQRQLKMQLSSDYAKVCRTIFEQFFDVGQPLNNKKKYFSRLELMQCGKFQIFLAICFKTKTV